MDVGLKLQTFNYKMRERRLEMGLTQRELGELAQVGITTVYYAETLTQPNVKKRGSLQRFVDRLHKIANYLDIAFDDLFPGDYIEALTAGRLLNKHTFYLRREISFAELNEADTPALLTDGGIDDNLDRDKIIRDVISSLPSKKEQDVIRLHFGIDCDAISLRDIAEIFGTTHENVRQIEASAFRRLRHPSRSLRLQGLR